MSITDDEIEAVIEDMAEERDIPFEDAKYVFDRTLVFILSKRLGVTESD